MIIGLYDADIIKYAHVPFNLELMKLSSYYKGKKEIVSLSPSFSPDMYNKFIYRKDYYDGDFPSELLKSGKIIYGGRAFNQEKYIPLELDIEKQKADVFIYDKLKKSFCNNKKMTNAFQIMQRAEHARLSLDGKNIWDNFEKQLQITKNTQTLFLHDYNLNDINDSIYVIKSIMSGMKRGASGRNLALKFPIIVNNYEDLLKWCQFSPSSNYFLLQYNGLMEDESLKDFIQYQKGTSIARQLDYYVTAGCLSEDDFIKNRIQKVFRQIAFLRMEKQKVNIKYENNFFIDKRWERLIDFFNSYMNSTISLPKEKFNRVIKFDSLYSFAANLQEEPRFKNRTFNKQEARELFQLAREKNYNLFKDFYECHTVELKGGYFEP